MHLINIPTMQAVIQHVVIGENEPAWFHGPAGCGKSQGIEQGCKTEDAQLIDFRCGQYDSVDFRGFPGVDEATQSTVWYMASTLPFVGNPRFDPDRKKVIFFDEADHGNEAVKGVLYQLVQERRCGEHVLQPNTYVCLAGNRRTDKGVGGKTPMPLNNRCTHYEVGPDADAFVMYQATQPRIPAELLAFLQFRKPLISTFDPTSPEQAFATPRTWEKVAHYFVNPTMPEAIKDASIEGAIGVGPAAEFRGFCKVIKDMPSMAAIAADPRGVPVSDKPEVRWAVAVGIAGAMDAKNTGAFQTYLDRMDPEFGILAWQIGLRRNETLIGTPEFIAMSRTHQAIFAHVSR